ncbi:DUF1641 domain-containing protein [Modicisalibacter sp. 'Wilcox']|uniref:DUF1641 domain-containing protein n=1 Tax=Modicisalibacter sp. 'Wilcox' TaxID=2679914 RepID=UPI0013D1353C|nr:DUF1641 domain-containing protein [Modicisalibacter sp. 'Wilcox']
MAQAIKPDRVPAGAFGGKTAPDAHDELERLIDNLHRRQVFRLLNDVLESLPETSRLIAGQLDSEGGVRGGANLFLLLRTLGRVPPEDLQRWLDAAARGISAASREEAREAYPAPGVLGVKDLLHDEALWHSLGPLLEGLKAFTGELQAAEASPGPAEGSRPDPEEGADLPPRRAGSGRDPQEQEESPHRE